jgi:hypothetical protein
LNEEEYGRDLSKQKKTEDNELDEDDRQDGSTVK